MAEIDFNRIVDLKLNLKIVENFLFKIQEYAVIDNYVNMALADGKIFIEKELKLPNEERSWYVYFRKYSDEIIKFRLGIYDNEDLNFIFNYEFRDKELSKFYGSMLEAFFSKVKELKC